MDGVKKKRQSSGTADKSVDLMRDALGPSSIIMANSDPVRFSCQARFIGRKVIHGPLNDIGLSLVVTDLKSEAKASEDYRCNLELCDKDMLITYIKKDEGFESDGESTKSTSTEEVRSGGHSRNNDVEEKIIKDHVFPIDDTSSANSSGGDSFCGDNASNANSPVSDLHKYKFDRKETYPIGDVLICHTDREFRDCVVWVVRKKSASGNTNLEAIVFECNGGEEEVARVYRKFLEISKRSKLERHRRRKSDGGSSVLSRSVEAILNRAAAAGKRTGNDKTRQSNNEQSNPQQKWSLVQHTDNNGVTHIEVEEASKKGERPLSLVEKSVDVDVENRREVPQHPPFANGIKVRSSEKSKFARELENILSKELETRRGRDEAAGQLPLSVIPSAGQQHHGRPHSGEPLSLRQRAPALLLKKLDEFDEKALRVWAKPDEDENRKVWSRPSKGASRTPPPTARRHFHDRSETGIWKQHFVTPPGRFDLISAENSPRPKTKAKAKARAPSPPTQHQPQPESKVSAKGGSNQSEKQILIPTKTGKEPAKKLYPKEAMAQNHELLRSRFLPLAPVQFSTASQPHSLPVYPLQIGGTAPPIAWARYPAPAGAEFSINDPNNNLTQMLQAHWGPPRVIQAPNSVEVRGRSRDRTCIIDPDARRRAQSKSPARISNKAVSHPPDASCAASSSSGLSRKFVAFMQRIGGKSNKTTTTTSHVASDVPSNKVPVILKSNLKKQQQQDGVTGEDMVDRSSNHFPSGNGGITTSGNVNGNVVTVSGGDNKKVHFNKFATVQMME